MADFPRHFEEATVQELERVNGRIERLVEYKAKLELALAALRRAATNHDAPVLELMSGE